MTNQPANDPGQPAGRDAASPVASAISSLKTLPDMRAAIEALVLFLMVVLAGALAGRAGVLVVDPVADRDQLFVVGLSAFIIPALSEELIFRSWIRQGTPIGAVISLLVFMLWHPAQVVLNLPFAHPNFLQPGFLAVVACLGLACTLSRIRSGSIWPAVIIHWGVAMLWKALFAGG